MLEAIDNNLWLATKRFGGEKMHTIYDQLLLNAKWEIINSKGVSDGNYHLRMQIEDLLIGHEYTSSVIFHTFPYGPNNNPLEIKYNKDNLRGKNILVYKRFMAKLSRKGKYSEFKEQIGKNFDLAVQNRFNVLLKITLRNNGKVSVFPAINRGPNYGYQSVEITGTGTLSYLRDRLDINLELDEHGRPLPTKANKEEYKKIMFLTALSMTYQHYTEQNQLIKTNFLLIMKEFGASISDPSICGFNHDKIFRLTSPSYFSSLGAPGGEGYQLAQITGSLSTEGNFLIGQDGNINPK